MSAVGGQTRHVWDFGEEEEIEEKKELYHILIIKMKNAQKFISNLNILDPRVKVVLHGLNVNLKANCLGSPLPCKKHAENVNFLTRTPTEVCKRMMDMSDCIA
jgi:hypothetical protein